MTTSTSKTFYASHLGYSATATFSDGKLCNIIVSRDGGDSPGCNAFALIGVIGIDGLMAALAEIRDAVSTECGLKDS